LHLIDGSELYVTEGEEEAAKALWSPPDPSLRRVPEKGYAPFTDQNGVAVLVQPAAVLYVTAAGT
jgi:hypothetical protein